MKALGKLILICIIIGIFNLVDGKLVCQRDPDREIYYGRSLNVQDCRISSFATEDFYRVNKIYGWGNTILKLTDNLFSATDELAHLDLHLNSISEISVQAFSGLNKLKTLFLHKNNITHLSAGTFDDLLDLEELNLDNNQIRSLEGNLFANNLNLSKLFFSYNFILSIQPHLFENLKSLRILNLAENICVRFNFLIEKRNDTMLFVVENAKGYPTTEEHWLKGCLENYKFHNEVINQSHHEKYVITAISGSLLVVLLISNCILCGLLYWHCRKDDDDVRPLRFFPIYSRNKPKRDRFLKDNDEPSFREVFSPNAMEISKLNSKPKQEEPIKEPIYDEITNNVDLIPKKPIRKMPTIP